MTIVAIIEAVAIVAVVLAFLRSQSAQEAAWTAERRELVNRVQRPDMLPVAAPASFEIPDVEPDESALVGSIDYGDD